MAESSCRRRWVASSFFKVCHLECCLHHQIRSPPGKLYQNLLHNKSWQEYFPEFLFCHSSALTLLPPNLGKDRQIDMLKELPIQKRSFATIIHVSVKSYMSVVFDRLRGHGRFSQQATSCSLLALFHAIQWECDFQNHVRWSIDTVDVYENPPNSISIWFRSQCLLR